MRLGDLDALMELYADSKDFSIAMCNVPIPIIRQNILDMPTIDAVPVVRCKDCKHCENRKKYLRCVRRSFAAGHEVAPCDFCSYGERKE